MTWTERRRRRYTGRNMITIMRMRVLRYEKRVTKCCGVRRKNGRGDGEVYVQDEVIVFEFKMS